MKSSSFRWCVDVAEAALTVMMMAWMKIKRRNRLIGVALGLVLVIACYSFMNVEIRTNYDLISSMSSV